MKKRALEICCDSLESVETAARAGADRLELCSGLKEGGMTPSIGLIRAAVATGIPVNVLIRPRGGDFVYSKGEAALMLDDVRRALDEGVNGVVIGALLPSGEIDLRLCCRLAEAAGDREVTFHRAFDVCADADRALDDIMAMGFTRVLTSGHALTAFTGIDVLKRLHKRARGRIRIMAGCGVNSGNAAEILTRAGVDELHASARSEKDSPMTYRAYGVNMGEPGSDEFRRMTADEEEIKKLKDILKTT